MNGFLDQLSLGRYLGTFRWNGFWHSCWCRWSQSLISQPCKLLGHRRWISAALSCIPANSDLLIHRFPFFFTYLLRYLLFLRQASSAQLKLRLRLKLHPCRQFSKIWIPLRIVRWRFLPQPLCGNTAKHSIHVPIENVRRTFKGKLLNYRHGASIVTDEGITDPDVPFRLWYGRMILPIESTTGGDYSVVATRHSIRTWGIYEGWKEDVLRKILNSRMQAYKINR